MYARYTPHLLTLVLLTMLAPPGLTQTTQVRFNSFAYIPDKIGGRPLVRVTMDRGITATFLIDTGASISLISPELMQRLGLTPKPWLDNDNLPVTLSGKPAWYVQPKEFFLGLQPLNVRMVVAEGKQLSASLLDATDGIIGSNILEQFAVLFDFQQRRITMYVGGKLTNEELEQAGMQKAIVVPRVNRDRGVFSIAGAVTTRVQADFEVDTGSDETCIASAMVRQLKLKPNAPPHLRSAFVGIYSEETALLAGLAFGDHGELALHNVQVSYPQKSDQSDQPYLLGMNWLSEFRLLLDYPQERAYFLPLPKRDLRMPFVKTAGVPAQLKIPIVNVVLNDGKPHPFAIDAIALTCVDKSMAAALKSPASHSTDAAPHDDTLLSRLCLADNTFCLNDYPIYTTELPMAGYGSLGGELIRNSAVAVDFGKRVVDLFTPGHLGDTIHISRKAKRIPLVIAPNGYVVEGTVDGVPTHFLLSLDRNESVLCVRSVVERLHPAAVQEEIGQGTHSRSLRLHQIRVGNAVWNQPIIDDLSAETSADADMLGTDFLRRFHVVLDYADQALYLEPDPSYREKDSHAVGVGITPTLADDGKMFVAMVSSPSPALDAGIQAGDEIVTIDGMVVQQTPLAKIIGEVERPEGTIITFTIRRKGEDKPREVKLKVRPLL
jgi:predicted aspartyl protease